MLKYTGQRHISLFACFFLFWAIFIPYYCYYQTNIISASQAASTATRSYFPSIIKSTTVIASANADYFPYGMFEDSTVMGRSDAIFRAKIRSMKDGKYGVRGTFDSILFTNGPSIAEAHLLNVADQEGFAVIVAPMNELNQYVWRATPRPSAAQIDSVVSSYVDAYKKHPSLIAYNTLDDANSEFNWGLPSVINAFRSKDRDNPASGLFVPTISGKDALITSKPDLMLLQEYPVGYGQAACDFTRFNSRHTDFATILQYMLMEKPKQVPVYITLQTHGPYLTDPAKIAESFNSTGSSGLREPLAEELRLQQWIAIGEGVKGIYWFTYSQTPNQIWRGVENVEYMYKEISDLSNRIYPLKQILLKLEKTNDFFEASSAGKTYISTLRHVNTGAYYLVAANHECSNQNIKIESQYISGKIRDLETGTVHNIGDVIPFRPGDGKIFEFIVKGLKPATSLAQNLVKNSSFEQADVTNTLPLDWRELFSATTLSQSKVTWVRNADRLMSVGRTSSLQITGPNLVDRNNLVSQDIQLRPNTIYTLSFYAKGTVRSNNGIGVQYVMTNPLDKEPLLQFAVRGSSDWQRRSLTFTTPSTYQQGRLDIAWDLGQGDVVWIDDVAICEGKHQCDDGNVILPTIQNNTTP